jgi:hypothetical protein
MNSKRLQLTTVHFLTLEGHLPCAIFDFGITSDIMDTPTTGDSLNTTVAPVKYWIIISLFRFLEALFQ